MSEWISISERMPSNGQKVVALSDTLEVGRPLWLATYSNHALDMKNLEAAIGESLMKNVVAPGWEGKHSFQCHDGVARNPADFHWWIPLPEAPPSMAEYAPSESHPNVN